MGPTYIIPQGLVGHALAGVMCVASAYCARCRVEKWRIHTSDPELQYNSVELSRNRVELSRNRVELSRNRVELSSTSRIESKCSRIESAKKKTTSKNHAFRRFLFGGGEWWAHTLGLSGASPIRTGAHIRAWLCARRGSEVPATKIAIFQIIFY